MVKQPIENIPCAFTVHLYTFSSLTLSIKYKPVKILKNAIFISLEPFLNSSEKHAENQVKFICLPKIGFWATFTIFFTYYEIKENTAKIRSRAANVKVDFLTSIIRDLAFKGTKIQKK